MKLYFANYSWHLKAPQQEDYDGGMYNSSLLTIMVMSNCLHPSQQQNMEIRKYFSISNHRTKQPFKQSQDTTENSLIEVVRLMIQPSLCCRGRAVVQNAVSWKMLNLWNPVVFCRISGRVFLHFYRTTSISCWAFCGAQAANSFNRYRTATLFSSSTL